MWRCIVLVFKTLTLFQKFFDYPFSIPDLKPSTSNHTLETTPSLFQTRLTCKIH